MPILFKRCRIFCVPGHCLTVEEDGTYDFANATSVVLTEDGKTEIFTDEKGYACTIPLPYGTYVVRETTTPHNFKPVDDFQVVINENKLEPQVWRVSFRTESFPPN